MARNLSAAILRHAAGMHDDRPPRRPHAVYDVGQEPDPRFSLANERTFLAWVRTSLAIVAGAVALHSLKVPETVWVRQVLVIALLAIACVVAVTASTRWARTERAMRLREPLPGFGFVGVFSGGIVVVAVL
ncbi:YidH family protein, partial [Nocardioides sp. CER28]